MKISLTSSAEQDLLDGYCFYERQVEGVGTYFLDSLSADIDALGLYAGIHPKPDGRLNRLLAKPFPSAIYYQLSRRSKNQMSLTPSKTDPFEKAILRPMRRASQVNRIARPPFVCRRGGD